MAGDSSAKRSHSELGADYHIETKLDKDVFSVLWTIEDYSVTSHLGELPPLVVVGGPRYQLSWRLRIDPRVLANEWGTDYNTHCFVVNLEQVGPEIRPVKADLDVTLLDADGKPSSLSQFLPFDVDEMNEHNVDPEATRPEYGWDKGMLTSAVTEAVVDDKLKLLCRISIYDGPKYTINGGAGISGSGSNQE